MSILSKFNTSTASQRVSVLSNSIREGTFIIGGGGGEAGELRLIFPNKC